MLSTDLEKIDVAVQTSLDSLDDQSRSAVEEELSKLREDKSLLEGKIRGYLTLSDICQEYKEELSRLRIEYEKLLEKVKNQEMRSDSQEHLSNASPTPDNDLGTNNGHEREQRNTLNVNTENIDPNKTLIFDNINRKDKEIHTTELFNTESDQPKSHEGSKSIPEITSDQSMEAANNKPQVPSSFDKYPMQESMAMSSHSHLNQESLTGLGFEHVSDQIALGESAGTYRNNQDLMFFASVTQQENEKTKTKKEVTELNEVITSLPLQSDETNRVVQQITKVLGQKDQQIKKLMHMNQVLIEKNTELQREKKEVDKDRQKILEKVQRLEKEVYNLSSSRSHSPQEGWVRVDKENETKTQTSSFEKIPEPSSSMTELREQNKMSAKEDALHQLNTANNRIDTLNSQLLALQDELSRIRREKTAVETELTVIRQQGPADAGRAVEMPLQATPDKTTTELKNENMVLRHQILLFQEDFDKERQDRATAQSIKDDLKKQNDTLKKKVRHLETKLSSAERQAKATDETNRKLLQDKEKLQQELSDVKSQLQRERENHAMTQYTPQHHQPVVQSAGFYHPHQQPQPPPQPPPQPQRMFGQIVTPPQPHPTVILPNTQYQHRPEDFRRTSTFVPASQPHTQHRNPIYPTNQPGQETEMLVGSWPCVQCTYVNYPGRTVCEMCGYIRSPTTSQPQYRPMSGPLTPRGDDLQQQGYGGFNVTGTRQTTGQTTT